ncbi:MAG: DUF4118 domain-containing protein [Desertimonas sp.]
MTRPDSLLGRFERSIRLGPPSPRPPGDPTPEDPTDADADRRRRKVLGYTAAIVFPIVAAAALIPLRDALEHSISLLMVVPVLIVALMWGARAGALAALCAAGSYDVLHTVPYYRPAIEDADDIVETVVLLGVGLAIGVVAEVAHRATATARIRGDELSAVSGFLAQAGHDRGDQLALHASASIRTLLDARSCTWRPGYHGTVSPVLTADGGLVATTGGLVVDGGTLPDRIEIPAGRTPNERGRFIVQTGRDAVVSIEQRRAAALIATAFAGLLDP